MPPVATAERGRPRARPSRTAPCRCRRLLRRRRHRRLLGGRASRAQTAHPSTPSLPRDSPTSPPVSPASSTPDFAFGTVMSPTCSVSVGVAPDTWPTSSSFLSPCRASRLISASFFQPRSHRKAYSRVVHAASPRLSFRGQSVPVLSLYSHSRQCIIQAVRCDVIYAAHVDQMTLPPPWRTGPSVAVSRVASIRYTSPKYRSCARYTWTRKGSNFMPHV